MPLSLESCLAVAYVRFALRFAPSRVLAPESRQLDDSATRQPVDADAIAATFARQPFSTNCLHRALALRLMLRRRGIDARLRIGIRRKAPFLPGHAWLEVDGRPVGCDAELVCGYVPLEMSETALAICYSR